MKYGDDIDRCGSKSYASANLRRQMVSFYCGNNDFLRHMRSAIGGPKDDAEFLNNFMDRGWYLDDLVTAPIDNLRDRKKKCKDARGIWPLGLLNTGQQRLSALCIESATMWKLQSVEAEVMRACTGRVRSGFVPSPIHR